MNEEGRPSERMPRRIGVRGDQRARGAEWAVAFAAFALLAVSVGGYLYHREQLKAIATEHLRLRICTPTSLGIGRSTEFQVLTTGMMGEPVAAQVEVGLSESDGKPILHQTGQTAADGLLYVAIPGQDNLPGQGVRLEVTAVRNGSRETFETQLARDPVRYVTCLITDKPSYRPGDTIFYRSTSLDRFTSLPAPDLNVQFEFQGADGDVLPESAHEGTTSQGVGNGAFAIPADLPAGLYALVVRSPQRQFPEARLPVRIAGGATIEREPGPAASSSPEVHVIFYPESGYLVSDVENRIYFTARNARGEPVALKGLVVDADDTPVAAVETIRLGMGAFSFRPAPQGGYRLRIAEPPGTEIEPELPETDPRRNVAISTGVGVFGPGKPLELNLRATQDGVPLVVAAWCRGMLVGQVPVVTRVLSDDELQEGVQGAGGVNQVTLTIPDEIDGLVRLIAYDYSVNPPVPIAKRWVYRRPARRLNIAAVADVRRTDSGNQALVTLAVTDEAGNPAAAVLAVSAVDKSIAAPAGDHGASLPACFLGGFGVDSLLRPENVDFDASDGAEADVVLDLLLGTHECPLETADLAGEDAWQAIGAPPIVLDNLQPLRQEYQQAIQQYRRDRTRTLNLLTTLSFFGGFGLVLAVAMLGLLGVVSGLRLWIPACGTALCCLLIGAILLAPLRGDDRSEIATAYLSFHGSLPREEEDASEKPVPESATASPLAIRRYSYGAEDVTPPDGSQWGGTLFWNPLLMVGEDGRAEIQFHLPDATEEICLRIEAHGAGRVGAVQTCPPDADSVY
ncbi:MAG: hypothetical protein RBS80_07340 [Thermoguttaceae bacterium]|nr:hypothetical protein [Thermoguttaceae bacterium]